VSAGRSGALLARAVIHWPSPIAGCVAIVFSFGLCSSRRDAVQLGEKMQIE